jgi:hypothetical protein
MIRHPARCWDRGEMNQRVHAGIALLDAEHGIEHLAVVRELHREVDHVLGGHRSVEDDDVPAVLDQMRDARAPELPGPAGHHHSRHILAPSL